MMGLLLAIMIDYRLVSPDYRLIISKEAWVCVTASVSTDRKPGSTSAGIPGLGRQKSDDERRFCDAERRLCDAERRLSAPSAPPAVVGRNDQWEGTQCAGGQCAVPRTLPPVRWRLFRGRAR